MVVISVFVLVVGGVWALLYYVAPLAIIRPQRVDCSDLALERPGISRQKVITEDGIELHGYLCRPETTKGVVIMLHGIGSCKEVYLELSARLAELQIASLVFDNRGQGKSGGQYVTFGYREKEDVRKIIDLARSEFGRIPLGIWGNSLGGAVALQVLAIDERPDFGVIESTFGRLDEVVAAYQRRATGGWGSKALTDYALKRAGRVGDFEPDRVRPLEAAKSIKVPLFLAHGEVDAHIPVDNGKAIFAALPGDQHELVIVSGADHNTLYTAGGEEYWQRLKDFLLRRIGEQP